MKHVFLLLTGLLFFISIHAENAKPYIFHEFDLKENQHCHHEALTFKPSFGFAMTSRLSKSILPTSEEVNLNQLLVQSNNVSLKHGCLKLKKGIYRLQYGVNLQNNSGRGAFISWLTVQPKHEDEIIISTSINGHHVSPFNLTENFYIQINQILYFNVTETSLICLNYRTHGNVKLSNCKPLITSPNDSSKSKKYTETPKPFYIIAVKVADLD
ncbi:MAG: hypothetical protein Q8K60_02050 [Parachlamydiaceae bacterium]|nr:hypothetical protein [Parachlamydiaceae bacterium]